MDLTRTAFGTWSGGRYLNLGEPLGEERFIHLIQHAYRNGIRTFMTADIYGNGAADEMLGSALAGLPRGSYCLVGAVGHDFYSGNRDESRGYPKFTQPELRQPKEFASYLRMATEKSLARCRVDKFDLLLLHNPDSIGYRQDAVWNGMAKLQDSKLTDRLGVSPGPANGFTLDLILCFERFAPLLDWATVILNPLEPWPASLCLAAAQHHDVKVITRGVDYGGLFHGDVETGHTFGPEDQRAFRPAGWVEAGCERMEKIRSIAGQHGLTMLQLACLWNLSQPAVKCIVPTLIQEIGPRSRSIESKADDLAALPALALTEDEREFIGRTGENKGCIELKGAHRGHTGEAEADRWELTAELEAVGKRWGIDPDRDLVCTLKAPFL